MGTGAACKALGLHTIHFLGNGPLLGARTNSCTYPICSTMEIQIGGFLEVTAIQSDIYRSYSEITWQRLKKMVAAVPTCAFAGFVDVPFWFLTFII